MSETSSINTNSQTDSVIVYLSGLCFCSVCAPERLTVEEVVEHTNSINPTGIDHGWSLSEDKTFSGGEPNPCVCESDPSRKHYLMVC